MQNVECKMQNDFVGEGFILPGGTHQCVPYIVGRDAPLSQNIVGYDAHIAPQNEPRMAAL